MINAEQDIVTHALFIYLSAQLTIPYSLKFEVDFLMATHHRTLIYSCQDAPGMTSWVGV